MEHSPRFLELVQKTLPKIQEINLETLLNWQQESRPFTLIDIREDHEWSGGHIPGAIHLGKGILERDIEKIAPDPKAQLVLYCGGGYRSALSAELLQQMGYGQVFSLQGGIRTWRDQSLELEC